MKSMNKFQFYALMVYAIDRDIIENFSISTVLFSLQEDAKTHHCSIEDELIVSMLDAYLSPWRDYGVYNKPIMEYGPKLEKYVMNGGLE